MINFKQRDDIVPSTIILVSAIVVAVSLLFWVFEQVAPKPSTDLGHTAIRKHMFSDMIKAKERTTQSVAAIAPRLWLGDPNTVSAAVLAQLTSQTTAKSLKLGAFRPQRSIVLAGITELPYSVQITGPYAGVRSVLESLDGTGSKTVLRSVQIATSEEQAHQVSVTLGISAYIVNDPEIAGTIKAGARQLNPATKSAAIADGDSIATSPTASAGKGTTIGPGQGKSGHA